MKHVLGMHEQNTYKLFVALFFVVLINVNVLTSLIITVFESVRDIDVLKARRFIIPTRL
mgnify:CR=1 FL=1